MKTIKIIVFIITAISLITLSTGAKKGELFNGDNLLDSCRLNIPLTYSKKNSKIVHKKAKELKGEELVLLQFNKKTQDVTYKRYYLESVLTIDSKSIANYLIIPSKYDDYLKGDIEVVFLKYQSKYDRFYKSTCFDSIMVLHKEILDTWIEK